MMNTHELAASLKPFSIAGIKFDGIACPTSKFSNSNLAGDPSGRGSIYLPTWETKREYHQKRSQNVISIELLNETHIKQYKVS